MLMTLVIIAIGISRLAVQNEKSDITLNNFYPKVAVAQTISYMIMNNSTTLRNLVLSNDADAMTGYKAAYLRDRSQIGDLIGKLDSTMVTRAGRDLFTAIQDTRTPFGKSASEVIDLAMANKRQEATTLLTSEKFKTQQAAYLTAFQNLVKHEEATMKDAGAQVNAAYRSALTLMTSLGISVLAIGTLFAFWTTRSITRPMRKAVEIAEAVAAGDLTARIEVTSNDETGQLLRALKDMNASLVRIVGEVRSGTDTIATASSQITSGNLDLSSRTEEQASSLEETASSMEELTTTVKHNADNARQANSLVQSAAEVAHKGGTVISQVVDTMGSINQSSKKIVDIIAVIDGIAFQTNILALNAAVEAARAGEQGRGFAVVASEVRNLAQRSAAAAKEIKTLIGDSVDQVDAGTQLVDQAGATMQEIVNSVRQVTDIMGEIAAASQEQTAGIEQINHAISQMDRVTQQNAALVEEAAAAAESLQDQAVKLTNTVSVFKLDSRQAGVARPAPKRKALAPVASNVPIAPIRTKRIASEITSAVTP
jgi:methyl-accepting chemotaxis protein